MSWFRRSLTFIAMVIIGSSVLGAKKEEGAAEPGKAEMKPGKPKDAPAGKAGASAAEVAGGKTTGKLSVPVPPGHDAKGLVIPMRDREGKLQMRFTMQIGKRTDLNHLDMTTLLIETFDAEGQEEMSIDLPKSRLDLNTRVITTEDGVRIKRADFELAGKTMEFNTETKAGRVGGKVKMLIYNLEEETASKPKENSSAK